MFGRAAVRRVHLHSRSGESMTEVEAAALVREVLEDAARVKLELRSDAATIARVARVLETAFRKDKHLYACGNGGSACDAMHFVEELVARYKRDRPGLPAHHLLDAPTITCWSNDEDYESCFERQVETLVREGDVLVAITTSGNSPNVLRAARAARQKGATVVGLTGRTGGRLPELCDVCVHVPADTAERIQEAHIAVIHLLCELLERSMFPADSTR
jgi:D-sedoheptulose 7-phosphate isomerase